MCMPSLAAYAPRDGKELDLLAGVIGNSARLRERADAHHRCALPVDLFRAAAARHTKGPQRAPRTHSSCSDAPLPRQQLPKQQVTDSSTRAAHNSSYNSSTGGRIRAMAARSDRADAGRHGLTRFVIQARWLKGTRVPVMTMTRFAQR